MRDNVAKVRSAPSVIAIASEQGTLKAVKLVKRGQVYELAWTRSVEADEAQLPAFAADCGLADAPDATGAGKVAVAGFDSARVVFYRINVPAAKKDEIAAMVKLQAEALLPLPADQMESAWRPGQVRDGQVTVTIAAARKQQLQDFVEKVRAFEPAKILLGCEGITRAWRQFFSGNDQDAVVVSLGSRHTNVCMAKQGRLTHAVSLDVGIDDFAASEALALTETTERFARDMTGVLGLFGCTDHSSVPVFVLSDGDPSIDRAVSSLQSAGMNATAALPDLDKLTAPAPLSAKDVCEFRMQIGLASMALDGEAYELNVFERLYVPADRRAKQKWFYRPKLTGALAAVMLVGSIIVFYAAAIASDRHLSRLETKTDFKELVTRQKLVRAVAGERPDLLALLREISSAEADGIKLHAFSFTKGEPIQIQGQADNTEQAHKFQESLIGKKGIKPPQIRTPLKGPKDEKQNFTITFHHGHFTKKKSRGASRTAPAW
ncbi:MAG: hypothetical protein ACYTEL_06170 [Planctomycetota bacterium]